MSWCWMFVLAWSVAAAPQLTSQESAIAWAMKGLDSNVKLNKICDAGIDDFHAFLWNNMRFQGVKWIIYVKKRDSKV